MWMMEAGEAAMWGWNMWWTMLIFWLVPLLVIGALIWGLLSARRPAQTIHTPRTERSALDILKERYALSEISREQYRQMREDLREEP